MIQHSRTLALARVLLVIVALNCALTFHNVWPTVGIRLVAELSLDLCLSLLLLTCLQHFRRRPVTPIVRQVLVWVVLGLIIGRYLQVSAPALFGRELNIYWDIGHAPAVLEMWIATVPLWQVAGPLLLIALVLFVLHRAVTIAIRGLCADLRERKLNAGLMIACILATGVYLAGRVSHTLTTEHRFALSVAGMYATQINHIYRAKFLPEILPPAPPIGTAQIAQLNGADVLLMFIESYGAVVNDRAEFSDALDPSYQSLADAAASANWQLVSGWVNSSTFGGGSWLAHASVLTGSPVVTNQNYRQLLASHRPTLARQFRAAGYRTIAVMPGLKSVWPEGSFYGFDTIYPAAQLSYAGPAFGWWEIPDQYTYDWLLRTQLDRADRAPLLVFNPAVMSHAPFTPTPPYLSDWSSLSTATAFHEDQVTQAKAAGVARPNAANYVAAIAYALRTLGGFISQPASHQALIVVIGDHQPPAVISGPAASHLVPIHVLSRDPNHLEKFRAAGFQPGIKPRGENLGGIETLYPLVLGASQPRDP